MNPEGEGYVDMLGLSIAIRRKKERKEEEEECAAMKEWHSHISLPQHVNQTFVSATHRGCHGYQ